MTYAEPAVAPNAAVRNSAGVSVDTDAVATIEMPVAMTVTVNTFSFGTLCLRWNRMSETTPTAAPSPSAVISKPKLPLPPPSTDSARIGTEGDDRTAADQAAGETDHDAAHERIGTDELQTVEDIAKCLRDLDAFLRRVDACPGARGPR